MREMVSTPYIFFLDSDTETQTPGFLEQAIE
ncbi:MAG: glycosyltransferase family 2 protein, partial [Bacteroidetes bacterium]